MTLNSVLVGFAGGAFMGSIAADTWGAALGGILGAAVGLASASSEPVSAPEAARARREAGRHAGDRPLSEGEVQSIARSGRQSTAIFRKKRGH